MYVQHPSFTALQPNSTIWRYMDLAKFLFLLSRRSLWFATPASLEDPWEGHSPPLARLHAEVLRWAETTGDGRLLQILRLLPEGERLLQDVDRAAHGPRFDLGMSCWHTSDHESDALWKIYGQAIAIRSTFERLANSFVEAGRRDVMIGRVTYTDPLPVFDDFQRVLIKRRSFEHEREVRAVISAKQGSARIPFDTPLGEPVPVRLEVLVGEVVVAPTAPDWFAGVVASTVARYGFSFPCRQSDHLASPASPRLLAPPR